MIAVLSVCIVVLCVCMRQEVHRAEVELQEERSSRREAVDESGETKAAYERKLEGLRHRKESLEQLERELERRQRELTEQSQRLTSSLESRERDVREREERCRLDVENAARLTAAAEHAQAVGAPDCCVLPCRTCM